MKKPFLSIIIPAHNEQYRLPDSLEKINDFLIKQRYIAEIIVVENGSTDNTVGVVENKQSDYQNLKLIKVQRRGKGLAVKTGMLAAKGQYRFLADADLSMPIEEINNFLPPKLESCDIAIGSREINGSKRHNEPFYRHLIGRVFNTMIHFLALPNIQDTQCGFKCFRADVAEAVFPLQTLHGMSFDVEVLLIAHRLGFIIQEIPINWYFNADSRVRLFKDSIQMTQDLITIRRNIHRGTY